jgi:hypothetical protein
VEEGRFCHGYAPAADWWPTECVVCRDGTGPSFAAYRAAALPDMPADAR